MEFIWNYSDTLFPFLLTVLLLAAGRQVDGFKQLLRYSAGTTMLMAISNYLADRGYNNMYLYHFNSLLEAGVLIPLIGHYAKISRKAIWLTAGGYLLFWIFNVLFLEKMSGYNSNSSSASAFLLLVFCCLYFLDLIKSDEVLHFQKLPAFWIATGFLFHSATVILLQAAYKYSNLFTDVNSHIIWKIQVVAIIIKFILVAIGILCKRPITRVGS
jgi:hypothetical protein